MLLPVASAMLLLATISGFSLANFFLLLNPVLFCSFSPLVLSTKVFIMLVRGKTWMRSGLNLYQRLE